MRLNDPTPQEKALDDIRRRRSRGESFTCFSTETMDAALATDLARHGMRLERYSAELWIVEFPPARHRRAGATSTRRFD